MNNILPEINDLMFYMDKEITILKVYSTFRLAHVQYTQTKLQTFVDINALTPTPDLSNSISIKVLGGILP